MSTIRVSLRAFLCRALLLSLVSLVALIAVSIVVPWGCFEPVASYAADQNDLMNRGYYMDVNRAFPVDEVSFVGRMTVLITDRKAVYSGKFAKVSIEFMNAYDGQVSNPVYKVEWMDKDGIMVDSTSWKPLNITGNQKVRVTEMANRVDVTNYKIIISSEER